MGRLRDLDRQLGALDGASRARTRRLGWVAAIAIAVVGSVALIMGGVTLEEAAIAAPLGVLAGLAIALFLRMVTRS